jgi:ribosome biogenesis GTPase A
MCDKISAPSLIAKTAKRGKTRRGASPTSLSILFTLGCYFTSYSQPMVAKMLSAQAFAFSLPQVVRRKIAGAAIAHSQVCAYTSSSSFASQQNQLESRLFTPSASSTQQQYQTSRLFASGSDLDLSSEEIELTLSGYRRPLVNWYPGHIAKAERSLSTTLQSVDVVIEVRDARCPKATSHPMVGQWTVGKPRLVVLTHADAIPLAAKRQWIAAYEQFGAAFWDADISKELQNEALQNMNNRQRWEDMPGGKSSPSPSKQSKLKPLKDLTPEETRSRQIDSVFFVDAKKGAGCLAIPRAVVKAGAHVNDRRLKRGLAERSLRVGIIGFPNVGKSALINRILGRRRAKSANTPGITRTLQWIRVSADRSTGRGSLTGVDGKSRVNASLKDFELLDSPGIIPLKMIDQSDALLLAACNSIGQGAYDNQGVASYLLEWMKTLHLMGKGGVTSPYWPKKCQERYGFDPLRPQFAADGEKRILTGEDMLFKIADNTCQGDPENASRKVLQDFRTGRWGFVSLQLAPESSDDRGQAHVPVKRGLQHQFSRSFVQSEQEEYDEKRKAEEEEQRRRTEQALRLVEEQGLELPPLMPTEQQTTAANGKKMNTNIDSSQDIGKGQFDGW